MTSYTARTSAKFLDLLLAMLTMLAGIFLNVKIAVPNENKTWDLQTCYPLCVDEVICKQ